MNVAGNTEKCGIHDIFGSSNLGELFLAEKLGHEWNCNQKRSFDAKYADGKKYEYKIARAPKYRITFTISKLPKGGGCQGGELKECIRAQFENIDGLYIAKRSHCLILEYEL